MSANVLHEPQTHPVADPTTLDGSSNAPLDDSSPLLLTHIKEYPLINSATGAFYTVPFTKQAVEALKPPFKYVCETQPIKFLADKTDLLANGALTRVDTLVPSLKTTNVKDLEDAVTRPFNGAIAGIKISINHIEEKIHTVIILPAHRAAEDLSSQFQGDLIRSKVNPVVSPMNNKLEKIIDNYLPHTRKVARDENACEIGRTIQIIKNVVTGRYEEPEVTISEGNEVPIGGSGKEINDVANSVGVLAIISAEVPDATNVDGVSSTGANSTGVNSTEETLSEALLSESAV
jgi:hypothetical protein